MRLIGYDIAPCWICQTFRTKTGGQKTPLTPKVFDRAGSGAIISCQSSSVLKTGATNMDVMSLGKGKCAGLINWALIL
jgi:hypothetical protein